MFSHTLLKPSCEKVFESEPQLPVIWLKLSAVPLVMINTQQKKNTSGLAEPGWGGSLQLGTLIRALPCGSTLPDPVVPWQLTASTEVLGICIDPLGENPFSFCYIFQA